jgi:deoxyribose-phosphate aldolase
MIPETKQQLAGMIDHTLLRATATLSDIEAHCAEAIEYGFCSVCLLGRWVSTAANILRETPIKIDAVAGFPFGADTTATKVADTKEMIAAGADEIDMVADLAAIIDGDRKYLANDLAAVLKVCRVFRPAVTLKVIIESAALTDEQIIFVCQTAQEVGVDFIKTATGFNPAGGAKAEDVRLMAQSAPGCRIKAAGGIKTAQQAIEMIAAGAVRLGTSASVQIVDQFAEKE